MKDGVEARGCLNNGCRSRAGVSTVQEAESEPGEVGECGSVGIGIDGHQACEGVKTECLIGLNKSAFPSIWTVRTFSSTSSCVAARFERAAVNFGMLGRDICRWNSDISRAVVKIVTRSRMAAFKVATGSGLLYSDEPRQAKTKQMPDVRRALVRRLEAS